MNKTPILFTSGVVLLPYLYADGYLRIDLNKGPQPDQQIFSFKGDDGTVYHFDIPKIKRMIAENPSLYSTESFAIRPEDVLYIVANRGVEEDHLIRLADKTLNENGLMVRFPEKDEIIIDGNHRMVARFNRHLDFMDFTVLTIEQAKPALLALPKEMECF